MATGGGTRSQILNVHLISTVLSTRTGGPLFSGDRKEIDYDDGGGGGDVENPNSPP